MLEYVHTIYLLEATVTYGGTSLKILGPKIWNTLATEIKRETSRSKFEEYVELWSGHSCKCNLCKSI